MDTEPHIQSLYNFTKQLGTGATAVVKLATVLKDQSQVAVKIVDKNSPEWDEFAVESFKTEMDIMKRIRCDVLVYALALHETEPFFYIVMHCIPGGDLFDAICEAADDETGNGQLPQTTCCRWLWDIITGLDYLHKMGVCHRDIKPENVLLTSKDKDSAIAKLADYGAAAIVTEKKPYMKTFTGTLAYMAPEVWEGKYTKAVDVWSLGVLAFVMLSGGPPFDGEDDAEITQAILDAEPQFDEYWADIDPLAMMFVGSCLSPEVKSRITLKEAFQNPWLKRGNEGRK